MPQDYIKRFTFLCSCFHLSVTQRTRYLSQEAHSDEETCSLAKEPKPQTLTHKVNALASGDMEFFE